MGCDSSRPEPSSLTAPPSQGQPPSVSRPIPCSLITICSTNTVAEVEEPSIAFFICGDEDRRVTGEKQDAYEITHPPRSDGVVERETGSGGAPNVKQSPAHEQAAAPLGSCSNSSRSYTSCASGASRTSSSSSSSSSSSWSSSSSSLSSSVSSPPPFSLVSERTEVLLKARRDSVTTVGDAAPDAPLEPGSFRLELILSNLVSTSLSAPRPILLELIAATVSSGADQQTSAGFEAAAVTTAMKTVFFTSPAVDFKPSLRAEVHLAPFLARLLDADEDRAALCAVLYEQLPNHAPGVQQRTNRQPADADPDGEGDATSTAAAAAAVAAANAASAMEEEGVEEVEAVADANGQTPERVRRRRFAVAGFDWRLLKHIREQSEPLAGVDAKVDAALAAGRAQATLRLRFPQPSSSVSPAASSHS
jgi:hypothetical protein